MTARDVWDGKPVTFVEFSIRDGKPVTEAFARDGQEGSFMLLVASMRWADTGEPVFADLAAVEDVSFKLKPVLARLSTKAAYVNGLLTDDPDAPPPPGNGHDTQADASPSH
jgi:hypothetical protein